MRVDEQATLVGVPANPWEAAGSRPITGAAVSQNKRRSPWRVADCSSAQAQAEKAFLVNGNAIVPWFFEDGPRAVWMAPSFFLLCAYVALLDVAHSTRRSCVQQKRC